MRSLILAAVLLSATASPVLAQQGCEAHRNNRVIGTVAGAGIGGVLGNVIAGSGDKTLATILGAVGGGVIGNQVTRSNGDDNCANAYGYYDKSGVWNPSAVAATAQTGYYDRDSNWVEGAPRGYYDSQNRWVAAQNNSAAIGYRDANGRWIAPAATEFDSNNRYSVGMVNGYWANGRWIAGDTSGRYDRNGRWQQGQADGRRDGNGNWVADAQPGYYDARGRWNAGTVRGRYDARGVFIAENANGMDMVNGYWQNGRWVAGRTSGSYDRNGRWQPGRVDGRRDASGNWIADDQPGYYDTRGRWNAGTVRGSYDARGVFVADNGYGNTVGNTGQRDIKSRFARLETRIDNGASSGALTRNEARLAESELASIRRYDQSLRNRNGVISTRNEARVQTRLDQLSDRLRAVRDNG